MLEVDPSKHPSFSKHLLERGFNDKIRMPGAFVKENKKMLAKTALLKTRETSDYFICKGDWPRFVVHHMLELGDMLIFYLVDKSTFHVVPYSKKPCTNIRHLEDLSSSEEEEKNTEFGTSRGCKKVKTEPKALSDTNFSKELHQSRIDRMSKAIKEIAFKKQQIQKPFEKGDEVEVASQEDGLIGSYYTATIISPIGSYLYRVKYKTLFSDDESVPLEDVVTASKVRPVPPDQRKILSENNFRLYDVVDVFANDGWWFGFISGIVGEELYVYFPTTADNIAYPPDVLRLHQEWSNGKWIFPPEQGIFNWY
ncbi:hypothetical protein P3S68_013324 [Capsicum galapagoense]